MSNGKGSRRRGDDKKYRQNYPFQTADENKFREVLRKAAKRCKAGTVLEVWDDATLQWIKVKATVRKVKR